MDWPNFDIRAAANSAGIFKWNPKKSQVKTNIPKDVLENLYGKDARECPPLNDGFIPVLSKSRSFDLIELEQLLQSVGWSQRPFQRVKRALSNSLLTVGLWKHDSRFPLLIGFARCTGDGVLEATIWDVAVSPIHQGSGLGKEIMKYILESLRDLGIERVTLFADPEVVDFYRSQGWTLEPKGHKCAFWYAN